MSKKISDTERVALIRKGNALFNEGKIEEAKQCFLRAQYGSGLIRVGDHYFYELKKPALALLLYRHAGHTKKVQEIMECIAAVIRTLLAEDTTKRFERAFPPAPEEGAWTEGGEAKLRANRGNPVFDSFMAKYGDRLADAGQGIPVRDAEPYFPPGSLGARLNKGEPRHAGHGASSGSPPRVKDAPRPARPSVDAILDGALLPSPVPPNRTPRSERIAARALSDVSVGQSGEGGIGSNPALVAFLTKLASAEKTKQDTDRKDGEGLR
jgi:hypothetical protein